MTGNRLLEKLEWCFVRVGEWAFFFFLRLNDHEATSDVDSAKTPYLIIQVTVTADCSRSLKKR